MTIFIIYYITGRYLWYYADYSSRAFLEIAIECNEVTASNSKRQTGFLCSESVQNIRHLIISM